MKDTRKALCAVLAVLLAWTGASAQTPGWTAILDNYVRAHADNGDFSGTVRVSKAGAVVFNHSYGLASPTFGVPNADETRFQVASITKTFTAAAIILLQQDGKLKIEDPLSKFLPDFPGADQIRIWHLLAHQGGLADPDYNQIASRTVSPDDLLRQIAAKPPAFKAGTDTRYSNAGYIVLARVIEKTSGKPFGAFLEERIFAPLGMKSTGHRVSGQVVPRLAEGLVPELGTALGLPAPQDPSSLYGSGSVCSTAGDLDLWLAAVNQKRLFDMRALPYPFGWGKRSWDACEVLVQSGINSGYSAVILTVPAEDLNIVVVMNTQSGFTADEGQTLLSIVHGQAVEPPARRGPPASVPAETLAGYTGTYTFPEGGFPMHIEAAPGVLTLRWADSASTILLTPLTQNEFLDRSSFCRVRFQNGAASWIDRTGKVLDCPRRTGG